MNYRNLILIAPIRKNKINKFKIKSYEIRRDNAVRFYSLQLFIAYNDRWRNGEFAFVYVVKKSRCVSSESR